MAAVLAVLDEQRLDVPARVPTLVERQSVTGAIATRRQQVEEPAVVDAVRSRR